MKLRILAILLLGTLVAAEGTCGDKKDKDALQGTWKVLSFDDAGKEVPKELLEKLQFKLVFTEDKYAVRANDMAIEEGTFKLDAGKEPRKIDLAITTGNDKGKDQLGIYQLTGDMLKVCFAAPGSKDRPTEFASKANPRTLIVVLQREKK